MTALAVTQDDHVQGNHHAKIILIEYGDYECPACKQAYLTVKLLQKHFNNQFVFIFRHFPLVEIHAFAGIAAETAEFAATYHKFWEMHDLIFTHQEELTIPLLFDFANQLSLPINELEIALQQGTFQTKIKNHLLSGIKAGVTSTPTFFVNDKIFVGSPDFTSISQLIQKQANI